MITNIVSRPGGPILHCPSFFRNFLCFSNQCIDSDLEFLILSLEKISKLTFLVYQHTPRKRYQSSILIKRINKAPSSLSSPQQSLPPPCLSSSLFSVGSTTLEHEVQYWTFCRKEPISLQIRMFPTALQMLALQHHHQKHSKKPYQLDNPPQG